MSKASKPFVGSEQFPPPGDWNMGGPPSGDDGRYRGYADQVFGSEIPPAPRADPELAAEWMKASEEAARAAHIAELRRCAEAVSIHAITLRTMLDVSKKRALSPDELRSARHALARLDDLLVEQDARRNHRAVPRPEARAAAKFERTDPRPPWNR